MSIPRNSPCPCGSGKKYKKCCAGKDKPAPEAVAYGSGAEEVPVTLHEAVRLHQAGLTAGAEDLYRRILLSEPNNADALHLLGVLLHQKGAHDESEGLLRKAVELDRSAALFKLNLGNTLKALSRIEEAVECYEAAVRLEPRFAAAHFNLANELLSLDRREEALEHYRKAVHLDPGLAEAHYNMGRAFEALGRDDEAIMAYERALGVREDFADVYYNIGNVLDRKGAFDGAIASYRRAVEIQPDFFEANYNLGNTLMDLERPEEAEACFRKALASNPNFASAYNNLAMVLTMQGRIAESIQACREGLQRDPLLKALYSTLGLSLRYDGRIRAAMEVYERALVLDPSYAEAQWNLALATLQSGELRSGWQRYEWRSLNSDALKRDIPFPRWDGSDLRGKSLLVYAEQGIGDQIMFASCLREIVAAAGHCIIECNERLAPLFARSFPGAQVVSITDFSAGRQMSGSGRIDFKIPMGSLPSFTRQTLEDFPSGGGYLIPDADAAARWRDRYSALGTGLKIGVSWRGGKERVNRVLRSTSLEEWTKLLSLAGVHPVCLQYGDCGDELRTFSERSGVTIHHWQDADPLRDLDDFAAQIAALDLVISVDNSTVHMAGALGVPTWALLPRACDWRWLRDVEDTPWYASVRLFRQSEHMEWREVFEAAGNSLQRTEASGGRNIRPFANDSIKHTFRNLSFNAAGDKEKGAVPPATSDAEKAKYSKAWDLQSRVYANYSPGLELSEHFDFLGFFKKHGVRTILDAGIGSGKLCKKMMGMGFDCHGLDIADNCLDADLAEIKTSLLTVGALWDGALFDLDSFDAVVCTDVLEHIPTEYVEAVLKNLHAWTRGYVFLQIALFDDVFGRQIGQPLHLTVKPKSWWDEKLSGFKVIHEALLKDSRKLDAYAVYLLEKK